MNSITFTFAIFATSFIFGLLGQDAAEDYSIDNTFIDSQVFAAMVKNLETKIDYFNNPININVLSSLNIDIELYTTQFNKMKTIYSDLSQKNTELGPYFLRYPNDDSNDCIITNIDPSILSAGFNTFLSKMPVNPTSAYLNKNGIAKNIFNLLTIIDAFYELEEEEITMCFGGLAMVDATIKLIDEMLSLYETLWLQDQELVPLLNVLNGLGNIDTGNILNGNNILNIRRLIGGSANNGKDYSSQAQCESGCKYVNAPKPITCEPRYSARTCGRAVWPFKRKCTGGNFLGYRPKIDGSITCEPNIMFTSADICVQRCFYSARAQKCSYYSRGGRYCATYWAKLAGCKQINPHRKWHGKNFVNLQCS